MIPPIGQMREPAVLLTPVRSVDEAGGEIVTYVEGNPIFVALRALTTTEGVQFGQVNADITHVCFGHWADLNALVSTQRLRIVETQQDFDIAGLPINDPKRAWARLNLVHREHG